MPKVQNICNRRKRYSAKLAKAAKIGHAESPHQSHLMLLPPELRNHIYELVLTVTTGVRLTWTMGVSRKKQKPIMVTNDTDLRPVNQLKYASRQLYHETSGLEIKFNCVVVDEARASASISRFIEFTKRCSAGKLQWLTQVVLEEKATAEEEKMFEWQRKYVHSTLALLEFCAANPHTTVALQVPHFELIPTSGEFAYQYRAYEFIEQGLILKLAFRGQDITYLAPEFGTDTSAAYNNVV